MPLSRVIAAEISRDAEQPGPLAASLLVSLQPLQHPHEYVLCQLFSGFARAGHAEEIAVDGDVMSLEQLGGSRCHSVSSHLGITREKRNNLREPFPRRAGKTE